MAIPWRRIAGRDAKSGNFVAVTRRLRAGRVAKKGSSKRVASRHRSSRLVYQSLDIVALWPDANTPVSDARSSGHSRCGLGWPDQVATPRAAPSVSARDQSQAGVAGPAYWRNHRGAAPRQAFPEMLAHGDGRARPSALCVGRLRSHATVSPCHHCPLARSPEVGGSLDEEGETA